MRCPPTASTSSRPATVARRSRGSTRRSAAVPPRAPFALCDARTRYCVLARGGRLQADAAPLIISKQAFTHRPVGERVARDRHDQQVLTLAGDLTAGGKCAPLRLLIRPIDLDILHLGPASRW